MVTPILILSRTRRRLVLLTLPLAASLLPLGYLTAQESSTDAGLANVPNDFDGDGLTDILTVTRGTSTLSWKSTPSSSESDALTINTEFGASTDIPVPGYWTNSLEPTLGRVRSNAAANTLTWSALKPGSVEVTSPRVLGKPGDLVMSGGDFNGDEIGDAAVARLVGKTWQWEVMTSPFSGASPRLYKFTLGQPGDRLSFVNLLGKGDWACAFGRDAKTKRSRLVARNVRTGKQRTYSRFPQALSNEPRPRPMPIRNGQGVDFVAFVTPEETETTVRTFTLKGSAVHNVIIQGVGTPLVGDFDSDTPGEEIAIYTAPKLTVINPFSKTSTTRDGVTGELVDQFTVVTTAPVATPTPIATAAPTVGPTAIATATPTE